MNILRIALFALALAFTGQSIAQPPRRRAEQQAKQQQQQNSPRGSAYRQFPTAQAMPQNVAWRRDLYRKLDLNKEANATLYYPTTPHDDAKTCLPTFSNSCCANKSKPTTINSTATKTSAQRTR